MQNLPVSTSTFRDIIKYNFLYVDKTQHIYNLLKNQKGAYFLARPRCFGKSLLVSTLRSLDEAMSQIKQQKYYEKFLATATEIYLIGVEFSQTDRNIGDWLIEKL